MGDQKVQITLSLLAQVKLHRNDLNEGASLLGKDNKIDE